MSTPSKFGLKLRKQTTVVTFDVKNSPFFLKIGDLVIAETNRGEEAGVVVKLPLACTKHGLHEEIRINHIIRAATEQDDKVLDELPVLENDYLKKANQVFEAKAPGVKLISCELFFSKKKLILYYRFLEEPQQNNDKNKQHKRTVQPPRLNVKDLNKELFHLFNIPIELKEMGNRASAYVIGGLGHCGCGLCCTTWLHKPMQVSVKMAKEQSLAINIPKLSGVCGKLLCCLSYEHTQYDHGVLQDNVRKPAKQQDMDFGTVFKA